MRMTPEEQYQMLLATKRKGFSVCENAEGNGWLVCVPARPRLPAHTQGDFKTSDRAWVAACAIAAEYA